MKTSHFRLIPKTEKKRYLKTNSRDRWRFYCNNRSERRRKVNSCENNSRHISSERGKIYLDGKDITDLDITGRAKAGIGFAFQQPVRFKGITVKDLITLASGKKIGVSEACEYLSEVGLCARDYINREVNASLSGGELKRIEIATVLARRSPITVFDEPEAGIDLWSFGNLISVFEKMHRETSGTIIIISHQERILSTADEIIVIADGSVKSRGASEEILPTLLDSPSVCKILTEKL